MGLADYRRCVAALYAAARDERVPAEQRWLAWRAGRDRLFREHPQSALDEGQRKNFGGLQVFPWNPALRLLCDVEALRDQEILEMELQDDGITRLSRFGRVHFRVHGEACSLSLYWLRGYGGGLFLPFRDATNGRQTYGGGRYLLDTIKHADLGEVGGKLVLDFNFAYNPSCAYNPRWHCPLAPAENWLKVAVLAGEKAFA